MEVLNSCPVCDHQSFTEFLTSTDFFLTQETFRIVVCPECGLKFVNPRPDEREISRYYESTEYISHDNEKKGILNAVYSLVRRYSVRKKMNLAERYSAGKTILDIGCGTGEFLFCCKKSGWNVTGIEPGTKPRAYANEKYGVRVLDEKGLDTLPESSYDVITLWHVLEHIYPLKNRIGKIIRLLKNDGALIVAVPNANSWDASHYKKFWAAYDLPRHIYHFSQKTISILAEKTGLEIEETVPMKFDSFYISLLSEKYMSGKKDYLNAIINGIKSNSHARKSNSDYSSLIFVLKVKRGEKQAI